MWYNAPAMQPAGDNDNIIISVMHDHTNIKFLGLIAFIANFDLILKGLISYTPFTSET